MKKTRKYSKKGFTLVELIVVLVILAVMAAMLVPALTGYIDEARKKKDYNAASEVLTAAQSAVARYYGDTAANAADPDDAETYITTGAGAQMIKDLTGINASVSDVTIDDNFVITEVTVTLPSGTYTYSGGQWS